MGKEDRVDAIVVGAGIGGLATAVALGRRGFRTTVYERAPEIRATGGALILWSNALKALDALGLREAVLRADSAQELETTEFRNAAGEHLTTLPVGEMSRRQGRETLVIARRELLALLHDAAARAATIRCGVGLCSVRQGPDGVAVRLDDGTEERSSFVVGADGLNSSLRGWLGLDAAVRRVGQDMWVGVNSRTPPLIDAGQSVATVGRGARSWYALLGDGRVFWYATIRDDGGAPADTLARLAERFAGWHAPVQRLIGETAVEDAVRTAMCDRLPRRPWGRGAVTLLGDAAHAVTPDLGQGACQALESAVALAKSVSSGAPVATALARYEAARFARVSDVNRLSWLVATTSSVADATLCAARDAAMRLGLRGAAMTQLDWLFQGTPA
jgi:2-polyprenyl-6-methoxyphenol hydroxylase-like FAD-dependent oxidoreductase